VVGNTSLKIFKRLDGSCVSGSRRLHCLVRLEIVIEISGRLLTGLSNDLACNMLERRVVIPYLSTSRGSRLINHLASDVLVSLVNKPRLGSLLERRRRCPDWRPRLRCR
jgi:hypothetical protein